MMVPQLCHHPTPGRMDAPIPLKFMFQSDVKQNKARQRDDLYYHLLANYSQGVFCQCSIDVCLHVVRSGTAP